MVDLNIASTPRIGIGEEEMRLQMRRVASPVTVVTCGRGDRSRGITIGSFASTSLTPPLVSFNLSRSAQMHEVLPFESDFLVHVLAADQSALSERFAVPDLSGAEQFADVATRKHESGLSIISGATLVLYCRMHNVFPAGDHSLVIGLVSTILESNERAPLVYFDQGYRVLGPVGK